MAEIWMGRREALGGPARDVALKLLSAERASNAKARKMLTFGTRFHELLGGVKSRSNGGRTRGVTSPEDKATMRQGKGCAVSME